MAVLPILKMGHPCLLTPAKPVEDVTSPAIQKLIDDMFETMASVNGAGLAAPQVGVGLQLVIFGSASTAVNPRYPDAPVVPQTILINPVLTQFSKEMEPGWEGCLSVPGMHGVVPRHTGLHYAGMDRYGEFFERTVTGFHARVVQHECDHLIGKLYPMRMTDLSTFGFSEALFPAGDAPADD